MIDSAINQLQETIKKVGKQVIVFGSQVAISKFVPLEYTRDNGGFLYAGIKWCIIPNNYLDSTDKLYIVPQEYFDGKIRYVRCSNEQYDSERL